MKFINLYKKIFFLGVLTLLGACSEEAPLKNSQLDVTVPPMTSLDKWIETNFVDPYNIRVIYKWNQNTVDPNSFVTPPKQEFVQPVLEMIQKIWINPYLKVGGPDFIKKMTPREIVMIGSRSMKPNGNELLGVATSGQRITLFRTDGIQIDNIFAVENFMFTVQHEYTHILNQYKPFDQKKFSKITPEGYTENWDAYEDKVAAERGFVSAYAQYNVNEDFAEMVGYLLTFSLWYKEKLGNIKNEEARKAIKAKEALVVQYFKEAYDIDIYQLREEIQKGTAAVMQKGR